MKSSMTKRALLLAAGGLGIAAVGVRVARRPAIAPTATAESTAAPIAGPQRTCAFVAGTTMSYSLQVSTEGKVATDPAGDVVAVDDQPQVHVTSGFVDLQSLAASGGDNVLLARLRGLDKETSTVAGDLSTPFLLKVDPACTITGFARLDGARMLAARTQQALAHELQWTLPRGSAQSATGENSLGAFVADFAFGRDRDGGFVTRSIARYTRLWNRMGVRPGGADAPVVSHRKVDLDDGPWFKSIEGTESSRNLSIVDAATHTVIARAATPADAFAGAPTEQNRYVWEDLLPKAIAVPSSPVAALNPTERKTLAQTTLSHALRDFNALTKSGANMKDTWPPLAQLLEVRPELATPLADKLVSGEIPPGSTAGVYVALSNAKVPEARDALLAINRNPARHMMDRSRAAFALVSRADVGVDLARDLHQDSQAITTGPDRPTRIYGREAALALGMMAGLKGEEDPGIKNEAVAAINEILGAGKVWHDLRPAFAMIANLGDAKLLGIADRYTRDPDPQVRQASTVAIRRMKPADSERFTLDWLQRESDPDVKRRLYTVMQMQVFDSHEIASDQVLQQAVADLKSKPPQQMLTRQAILRTIKDAVEANPKKIEGLREALRDQLEVELREQSGLADLISPLLGAADIALAAKTVEEGLQQASRLDNVAALPARTGPQEQGQ
jgi:hypothetical protein